MKTQCRRCTSRQTWRVHTVLSSTRYHLPRAKALRSALGLKQNEPGCRDYGGHDKMAKVSALDSPKSSGIVQERVDLEDVQGGQNGQGAGGTYFVSSDMSAPTALGSCMKDFAHPKSGWSSKVNIRSKVSAAAFWFCEIRGLRAASSPVGLNRGRPRCCGWTRSICKLLKLRRWRLLTQSNTFSRKFASRLVPVERLTSLD